MSDVSAAAPSTPVTQVRGSSPPPASSAGTVAKGAATNALGGTVDTAQAIKVMEADGMSPATAQQIVANPQLMQTLQTLPTDVTSLFKTLDPNEKKILGQDVTGHTRVGFVNVDNGKAFVSGKGPLGVDAFPYMDSRVDDHVKKGLLTSQEGDALKQGLALMKPPSGGNPGLSPQQRSAIVSVLSMEMSNTDPA